MKKISLTKGKFAIVDDDDFKVLSKISWSFHHLGYAVRGKPQVAMHRLIMKAKKNQLVDHKNRNKLDNRKRNLRLANRQQNNLNSLFQDGTHYRKDRNAWIVRMNIGGKKRYIGYFKNKRDAKSAYKKASLKYHKEFSPYA